MAPGIGWDSSFTPPTHTQSHLSIFDRSEPEVPFLLLHASPSWAPVEVFYHLPPEHIRSFQHSLAPSSDLPITHFPDTLL